MGNLVFGDCQILGRLGGVLTHMLLFLVELVDHLILVGNFIVEAADGGVAVGLLLLNLLDCHVNVVDVFLHSDNLLFKEFLISSCLLASLFFLHKSVLGVGQLNLEGGNGSCGLRLLVVILD